MIRLAIYIVLFILVWWAATHQAEAAHALVAVWQVIRDTAPEIWRSMRDNFGF